jgi:predicted DNA-binding antitoxin AbrB/MazE fold protein
MSITVDAIYENGVLRLKEPIPLAESASVRVTIEPQTVAPASGNGDAQATAAWLAQIAAMPMEPGGEEFAGRDHDRILYGPKGAR